jgi:hypothetical protein
VVDFVRQRENDWRWWDNPTVQRPLVSLVALTPDDDFETARPPRGITLRVRCACENTTQGLPKRPMAELLRLSVDGRDVTPELVVKKQTGRDVVVDQYHQYPLPEITPGKHTARAVVRLVGKDLENEMSIVFGA